MKSTIMYVKHCHIISTFGSLGLLPSYLGRVLPLPYRPGVLVASLYVSVGPLLVLRA